MRGRWAGKGAEPDLHDVGAEDDVEAAPLHRCGNVRSVTLAQRPHHNWPRRQAPGRRRRRPRRQTISFLITDPTSESEGATYVSPFTPIITFNDL